MNKDIDELRLRRSELLARISTQRNQVTETVTHLQASLSLANRGFAAVRLLRSHPLLAAGIAVLIMIRRRGVTGMAMGMLGLWRGYRYFTRISTKLPGRG